MKLVLDGVRLPLESFDLAVDVQIAARVTGLFGPSGSGKTSVLDLVAGLRRPVAGRLDLDGRVLADPARGIHVPPRLRRIGYVPQDGALFPHMTVRRNLLYGAPSDDAGPLRLAHVAEVLEIGDLLDRGVTRLSGGEQRRVALGRALVARPLLLVLDEPLAGLDHPLRARILPLLKRVRDEFGVPMLYVSHDPSEVLALCDEVVVLDRGRVTARRPPRDLFTMKMTPTFEPGES